MASDNPIQLIADVHHYHQWRGEVLGCGCGWNWPEERTYFCGEEDRISKAHSAHVAAEIDKALGGLTREWLAVAFDARGHGYQVHRTAKNVDQLSSRWVSGWSEVQP